jgi:hypothetical protein
MDGSFSFTSICPRCGQLRPQEGLARGPLLRSLALGHLIEGYCAACDELWPISARERDLLAASLSQDEAPRRAPRGIHELTPTDERRRR